MLSDFRILPDLYNVPVPTCTVPRARVPVHRITVGALPGERGDVHAGRRVVENLPQTSAGLVVDPKTAGAGASWVFLSGRRGFSFVDNWVV